MEYRTKVIFRVWKDDGEVIAFFPEIPGTASPFTCLTYMHVGQHASADIEAVELTRPAKPEEFEALKIELKSIGYELKIAHRFTKHDLQTRKNELRRMEGNK